MAIVSVIMRTYNQAEFIDEAIQSVLNQTFSDFELIIVNDGSTDNTKDILSKYVFEKRIRIFNQENKGRGAAGNFGISKATGEFISFLDSDDLWYPNYLMTTLEFMGSNQDVDVVYTGWEYIDENGNLISEQLLPKTKLNYTKELILGNLFPIHTAVLKREYSNVIVKFDPAIKVGEDWKLWFQLAYNKKIFYAIPKCLAKYRRHENCTTRNVHNNEDLIITVEKIFLDTDSNFRSKYFLLSKVFNMVYISQYSYEMKKYSEMHYYLSGASEIFLTLNPIIRREYDERLILELPIKLANIKYITLIYKGRDHVFVINRIIFFLKRFLLIHICKALSSRSKMAESIMLL